MNRPIKTGLAVAIACLCSFAHAAVTPHSLGFDSRISTVKYNARNVITVNTKVGTNTLIQLDNGETISNSSAGLGIGDANAWGFSVRGNNIFLKPTAKHPDTNLTIVSDQNRTYSFELVTSNAPHYIVKMDYSDPKKTLLTTQKSHIPCGDGALNFEYGKWGSGVLSPKYMWDDGRFTCLKFANNAELPVAYQVASDGTESLINYHIEKDTMILHGISNEFRLRLGKDVLGLFSSRTKSTGFNPKASSTKAVRGLKYE
ncbi:TrbG/VirB9 family P-type conjugative transfer protein [Photobacterium indicum]|uniref:TrbG/VirB9 family P-type conjugative transfer protein n=1 Tax=Photobacterium indicum TaxID=81447 RepID=UPI003D0AC13F